MEISYTYCTNFLFKFLHGFFLLCMITCPESTFGSKSDRLALLDFKRRITEDPLHIMNSWNDSVDLCSWVGVTCNHANKRVMILNLEAQKLVGSVPPSIGNLTYLTGINLIDNNFHGEIPQEIGRLLGLQYLNLSSNSFGGKIPTNISHCTQLRMLDVGANKLIGSIPNQLNSLLNLTHFWVDENNLTGTIPDWIGNFSFLYALSLAHNNFEGSIPNAFGRLTSLGRFVIPGNKLSGTVPSSIFNISSLYYITFTQNQLQGELPQNVGTTLPNLEIFSGGVNKLTGSIPVSLSNASKLRILDFAENGLTGKFPAESFETLKGLVRLNFDDNRLGSGKTGDLSSLSFLANCTNLEVLSFSRNRFGGELPESIANLSTKLRIFTMGGNLLHGNIPTGVVNLVNLTNLGMEQNYLGGSVPDVIGKLQKLQGLYLNLNQFSGTIPSTLGNLTSVTRLFMEGNRFEGSIPPSLGNCQSLLMLNLSSNQLSGTIPNVGARFLPRRNTSTDLLTATHTFAESFLEMSQNYRLPYLAPRCTCQRYSDAQVNFYFLDSLGTLHVWVAVNKSVEVFLLGRNLAPTPKEVIGLSSLSISLSMSNNSLTGSLPSEVGELVHLSELDVSGNKLSGEIPITLGSCTSLVSLHLEGNQFEGTIPQSLANLRGLEETDISRNNLSGQIPEFLAKLRALKQLNISHNEFEGELPTEGIFSNASGFSVLGNNKLCGGIRELRLHACTSKSQGLLSPKVMIPLTCAIALIITLSCFIAACALVKRSRGRPLTSRSNEESKLGVSYLQLVESTNRFSPENLIGSGSFGSVYRGVLSGNGMIVAIKVLNLQQEGASKSFIDECKALRSVRHRNLLKIITACSSIDSQGNEFKSLVYEFMENGSLDPWLHPRDDEQSPNKRLSLTQRLNIAIDVASALDYLHHNCETCIVHCDLKPSNILLDEDMVAHVGDFGLARFLLEASNGTTLSVGLKGSIGYIPPEYGMGGQVSTQGDVYSYGILLLEMFTGKRPTDDIFKDGLSIHQFTAMALPDHIKDVVEPSLLLETDDEEDDDGDRYGNKIQERSLARYKDPGPDKAKRLEECLYSVIQIGISCSAISPGERMLMNVVVNKMGAIRDSYLNLRRRR